MLRLRATLLFVAVIANCQDLNVILKRVSERYKTLDGYRLQGTYDLAGGRSSEVGTLAWTSSKFTIEAVEKAGKLHVDYKGPALALTYVTNGATVWTYLPSEKSYTKVDAVENEDDQDGSDPQEEQSSDNPAESVYKVVAKRFSSFDKMAARSELTGEQDVKTSDGKTACWVVTTHYSDRKEKNWIAQSSFMVLRSEISVTTKELTTRINVTIKQVELEPPSQSAFVFIPGKKDKEVDELHIPGTSQIFIGKPAADFTLKSVEGEAVRLSEFRGKVVVLDFWATWCPPCRQELPVINKLSAELKDKSVVFLGINDEGSGTVKSFNKRNSYTFVTLQDPGHKVAHSYQANSIPNVFVIGKDGVIVKHFIGSRDEKVLLAGIAAAQVH